MNNCFIILAGGESKRFNSKIPKPYHLYKGKPLLLHSIDKVKEYAKFNKIVLVINKKHKAHIKKLKIKDVKIIIGGKTRAASAYNGLKSVKSNNSKPILTIKSTCRFLSLNFTKLLSINVKKVKNPKNSVIIKSNAINIFFLIKSIIMR